MSQLNVNTGNSIVSALSSSTDLASLFKCPVCSDYVLSPILQCQNGHLVCTNCRPKHVRCPMCRCTFFGNIRNLALEQMASNVMFPCKYSTSGCTVSLMLTEKADHEDTCKFHLCSCPYPGSSCKWQGSLEEVVSHLTICHNNITPFQGEDVVYLATDIDRPGTLDWVMMQSCFGYHFMLLLEKQEQQFFAVVKFVGSKKQAENFAYRLELNGHRRRLTWEAMPRSIHEGVSSDCLVFHTSTAQVYANNGDLGINVTISMVYPEKSQKKRKI